MNFPVILQLCSQDSRGNLSQTKAVCPFNLNNINTSDYPCTPLKKPIKTLTYYRCHSGGFLLVWAWCTFCRLTQMGCFFFPGRTCSWINYNSCLIQALNKHNGVIIILLEGGVPGKSWQPCNNGTQSWRGSSAHKRCAKQSRLGSMCWGREAAEQHKLSQRWSWSVRPPDKQTPAKEKQGMLKDVKRHFLQSLQSQKQIHTVPNQRVM